ncbi:HAD-like domain-containing protein [Gigaspora rosea]|uniref:HAD-like domain-containing protein n=1 Tax=Gigaspora rosea TaxID=44941 RepID=A0A397TY95_9GLOM|nr:HAD-like domain-containing protein [Gigaspora rosea]
MGLEHGLPPKISIAMREVPTIGGVVTMHILMKMENFGLATDVALFGCLIKMKMNNGKCTLYFVSETHKPPLEVPTKESVMRHVAAMFSFGLRVASGSDSNKLTFVGCVAIYDPPRKGIPVNLSNHSNCLTGADIEAMSSEDLRSVIGSITVFARIAPKHKMTIIQSFQANGSIVTMAGDGVNDAPALKIADIGISMVNDEFVTILDAVKELELLLTSGFDILNFLTFQLSTGIAALTLITMPTVSGLPNTLNAMQILWITVFQIEALGLDDLFGLIVITSSVFWIDEFRKYYHNQKHEEEDYGTVAAMEMA